MVSKGLAKGTANRGLVLLKYMFNLALKWNTPGVTVNPAAGVKLFNANNARERYLTAEETQRLLAAVEKSKNTQLKYIVPLLLLLGCRKRELLDARWEEFDLDRRIWRIPMSKSGKSRHVPLSKAALEIIQKLPRFDGCSVSDSQSGYPEAACPDTPRLEQCQDRCRTARCTDA